jgi:hypothetical protein
MNHLTNEDLMEHYRGTGPDITRHLQECVECGGQYEVLKRALDEMKAEPVPERTAEYGEQVWLKIRHTLPAYEKRRWSWWILPQQKLLVCTAACLILVTAAFVTGRLWERSHSDLTAANTERVFLFVVGDHLDRSERLLVELDHANPAAGTNELVIEEQARDLLRDNRLYRQTAAKAGDPALTELLDRLGRVLVEVANDPRAINTANIQRSRHDMNIDGLLFELRVLRSQVSRNKVQDRT